MIDLTPTMRRHEPGFLASIPATRSTPTARSRPRSKLDGAASPGRNVTIREKAKVAETLDEFRAALRLQPPRRQPARLRRRGAVSCPVGRSRGHATTGPGSKTIGSDAYKERAHRAARRRAPAAMFHEMHPLREPASSRTGARLPRAAIRTACSTSSCSTSAAIAARTRPNRQAAPWPMTPLSRTGPARLAEARSAEFDAPPGS